MITVELADGRSLTHRVAANLGTPANPMSDDDLAAKFTDNAAPRFGTEGAARLLDACWAALRPGGRLVANAVTLESEALLVAGRAGVLAKIEKPAAFERLDEIIELSDALMVARGDLGVELPLEQVPGRQKQIVRAARGSSLRPPQLSDGDACPAVRRSRARRRASNSSVWKGLVR